MEERKNGNALDSAYVGNNAWEHRLCGEASSSRS